MGATLIADTTGPQVSRGAPTDELDQEYLQTVMEQIRSIVDPVPGSGPLRGVWYYSGAFYAFRDDELGLIGRVYTVPATATSVLDGWIEVATGVTLLPGGRYEFINYNFTGHTGTRKMYGVDGVNKGFQFDGTTFTQITTAMTTDTPEHLIAHKKHLFYSFSGGSVQHSSIGDPTSWSVITGAAELAMGDEITGFSSSPKVLFILCRNSSHSIKGTSVADWDLDKISDIAGALEWTIQRFNYPVYLDDRGITTLESVQEYGDFYAAKMSQKIQKLLRNLKNSVISSIKVKEKDQYRLFFEDQSMLTFSFNGKKMIGVTPSRFNVNVRTVASVEDDAGEELLLFGDDNGFVHMMDSGNNFDGGEVEAWIRPVFNHFGSPEYQKQFFKTVLEIDADQAVELTFLPSFEYDTPDLPPVTDETDVEVSGGGGYWDDPETIWEDFYFDSQVVSSAYGYTEGVGTNFSLFIRSLGTYEKPHTIQGAIIHYSLKGVKR